MSCGDEEIMDEEKSARWEYEAEYFKKEKWVQINVHY